MHENAQTCECKTRATFPATTPSYSMAKITRLDVAFSEIFELEASPVEGQSLQQKDMKRRKKKGACPRKNLLKHDVRWKKTHAFMLRQIPIGIDWANLAHSLISRLKISK